MGGHSQSSTHAAAHTLLRFIGVVVLGGLRAGRVLVPGFHRVQGRQRRAIVGQQSPASRGGGSQRGEGAVPYSSSSRMHQLHSRR